METFKKPSKIVKAERMLNWIKDRVFDSDLEISRRGVPHLLILREGTIYSVCYFSRSRMFRIFYPFGSFNEKKFDIKLRGEVVSYFTSKGDSNNE